MSESTEVERLRARVAELEAAVETSPRPPTATKGVASVWRLVLSATALTMACALAPLSVTAVWASAVLSDTGRYVDTVAPLADNAAVRAELANEVTTTVLGSLDVDQLTSQLLQSLAAQENVPPRVADALPALAVPLSNGIEEFTRTQVNSLMATPQFAQLWEQVNRVAHAQIVRLLEGDQTGAVTAQDGSITLNLAPIIEQVRDQLVAQGFTLASNIPTVDKSFVLVQSDAITQAQGFYSLLNTLGGWLPVIAVVLFAVGVYLGRDRRRALLKGALGVAGAMVLLGGALTIVRLTYVESTPAGILTPEAAAAVFDTLVRFLRTALRAVAVLALFVALAAFLLGPSVAAVRTRSWLRGGVTSLRGGAEAAGWNPGRAGIWTAAHKAALQVGILAAAGLVLMFWTVPTVGTVVLLTVVVLLFLAAVEFVARPAPPAYVGGAAMAVTGAPHQPPVEGLRETSDQTDG